MDNIKITKGNLDEIVEIITHRMNSLFNWFFVTNDKISRDIKFETERFNFRIDPTKGHTISMRDDGGLVINLESMSVHLSNRFGDGVVSLTKEVAMLESLRKEFSMVDKKQTEGTFYVDGKPLDEWLEEQ